MDVSVDVPSVTSNSRRATATRVRITETALRDAHQSLLATRMKTDDMLPIAEKLDDIGYFSLEVWGGATFDTCLRYLDEDPWDRLRALKARVRKTPLQMLLRGQNLVGYHHYPDDVVDAFVTHAVKCGIDVMRIFDALNDVRNMEKPMEVAKREGAHVQACVVYTLSPVHDVDHYVDTARRLEEMGADSICVKDMAGLISPLAAYELVRRLKETVRVPVQLHSHYTSGMASMAYLKAVEAGVDCLDTAISALALGPSQPPTESIVAALQGTAYDTSLDLAALAEVNAHFVRVRPNYQKTAAPITVNAEALRWQIPGGMLSNLRAQLANQGMLDRLDEVLAEVPRVREELGYPPLVTPMSQIVGTQAVLNVATGKRYSVKSREIKDYVRGLYGRPPAPIPEDVRRMVIGEEDLVTVRPADLLEPELEKARQAVKDYIQKDEDVLTYVMFPEVALEFFRRRAEKAGTGA
ncbi:MAG: pyruvate carboxylase subunit B [Firmicutes bacterium]|jgi:oxaloacetate decarboxylase alpha subunit|nr:pyruvate carboxylase subunit B [Bacillota bacterium]MDH7495930.1 pyruvate carboxylase subunit B [Bacillota bacterium]